MMRRLTYPIFVYLLLWTTACQSTGSALRLGLQPGYEGYIPARIAVLPCQTWPNGASYPQLALTNADSATLQSLCQRINQAVLDAFAGQPYMKGFTPSLVQKLVEQAERAHYLAELPTFWRHYPNDCTGCSNAPSVYHHSIAAGAAWRTWLHGLSTMTRYADAALLPFLLYAHSQRFDDRGLLIAERSAGVVLLLIDTNNARLLWCGQREAALSSQKLRSGARDDEPLFPEWAALETRLLSDDLWKDFPGKQWY